MSVRRFLFRGNPAIEHSDIFDMFGRESVQRSVLRRLFGDSPSMRARYGDDWHDKQVNCQIGVATLEKVLTKSEFQLLAAELAVKWGRLNKNAGLFYGTVAEGRTSLTARLAALFRESRQDAFRNYLAIKGLGRGGVKSLMGGYNQVKPMADHNMEVESESRLIVYKTVSDGRYHVDGLNAAGDFMGLEFTPWAEWLGMAVDVASRALYGDNAVMMASLDEMMTMGGRETTIQKKAKAVKARLADRDSNVK